MISLNRLFSLLLLMSTILYSQVTAKLKLDLFNSVVYNSNREVERYISFPGIISIYNESIFLGTINYTDDLVICEINSNQIVGKYRLVDEYFISFDMIINGPKYFRFIKGERLYFVNRDSLKNVMKLEQFPSIEISKIIKTRYNNFEVNSLFSLAHKIDINEELEKHKLKQAVPSGAQGQQRLEYYRDGAIDYIILNSYEHISIYPYSQIDSIANSSIKRLKLKRNTIFAFYGREFKTKWLQDYFDHQSWYKPNPNYADDLLNEFDKEEIQILKEMENKLTE